MCNGCVNGCGGRRTLHKMGQSSLGWVLNKMIYIISSNETCVLGFYLSSLVVLILFYSLSKLIFCYIFGVFGQRGLLYNLMLGREE